MADMNERVREAAKKAREQIDSAPSPAERVRNLVSEEAGFRLWLAAASEHPDYTPADVAAVAELKRENPDIDTADLVTADEIARARGTILKKTPFAVLGAGSTRRKVYPASCCGLMGRKPASVPVKVDLSDPESVNDFETLTDGLDLCSDDGVASWVLLNRYGMQPTGAALPDVDASDADALAATLSHALAQVSRDAKRIDTARRRHERTGRDGRARTEEAGFDEEKARRDAALIDEIRRKNRDKDGKARRPEGKKAYTPTKEASVDSVWRDLAALEKTLPRSRGKSPWTGK